MSTLAIPNSIVNGGALDASKVDQNFSTIQSYVNTNAIVADGTKQMTAQLLLQASTNPTLADHAARKAYVDSYFPVASGNLAANAVIAGKIAAGTIVNADINAAAAIAKTKLAALNIVDADVQAGAAIAYSKLALGSSIKLTDFSTAAGEMGAQWQSFSPSTNNVSGPGFEASYMKAGPHTIICKFRFTVGSATATGPVQLGMPWTFSGNITAVGIGFNAACRIDCVSGTNTVNIYKDATTLNWTSGNSVAGAGFQIAFEI